MTRLITALTVLCALLGAGHRVDALGPPVEIHGTLDLMDPQQAFFFTSGSVQLTLPVDATLQYENTDRLALDIDFADMKHLEITGTNAAHLTVGLLFDDGDLRNTAADIEVMFGFTDMQGAVIGDLLSVPFADVSGPNQIGATSYVDTMPPIVLPTEPLVFHDIVVVIQTTHPDGLFSVDSFSFSDGPLPAVALIGPLGNGSIQIGEWVPEPRALMLVAVASFFFLLARKQSVVT